MSKLTMVYQRGSSTAYCDRAASVSPCQQPELISA
jgi:hypothetical protein